MMANIKCWLVRLQSEAFTESFVDGHLPKHGSSPCHLPHSRIFYVYLSIIAQIILCSSHNSDNCQVHIQLIPEGLSFIYHMLLSYWPYSSSFTFMPPTHIAP